MSGRSAALSTSDRPVAPAAYALWRDRRGRIAPLRVAVLAGLLFPLALAIGTYVLYGLGPRPLDNLVHRAGYWALLFLLISLAITPLRFVGRFNQVHDVRRMIGVGAFAYASAHILLFVADEDFAILHVIGEIFSRIYLIIGLTAFLGLAALALTSTDGMVKRLGGVRWRRLHQLAYVIAILALVHFFQQTKADIVLPILIAGLFTWLMGYRLLAWRLGGNGALNPTWLLVLAIAVSVLTFLGEAVGLSLVFPVTPGRVLQAALSLQAGIRPGWIVLAAGLAVVALDLARRHRSTRLQAARPVAGRA
ncbi:sulfite oxidase heme-binding subunit YedZ [Marinivivus vitaminiproducens]|uniref:sulfite oxidase heme-binding subunit YedZ n=1 Tax=Marinivivus vitaminiproducens TaxID=3035935 RepID=UPI00279FCDD5|nr:ferric reductase-like transmembrane domain-containing protein [Geminicoccaceae bacterium SCSIO 64248]